LICAKFGVHLVNISAVTTYKLLNKVAPLFGLYIVWRFVAGLLSFQYLYYVTVSRQHLIVVLKYTSKYCTNSEFGYC